MRIVIVAIGHRMPAWADEALKTYTQRLPRGIDLVVDALPAAPRRGGATDGAVERESDAILKRLKRHHGHVVALDERGKSWSSMKLSRQLQSWMQGGDDVALLIGGADGLSQACLDRAEQIWSLSSLTFPHALARVIVAEQIYRAASIISGHPYHRE